jgi:hypothetical protein
MRSDTGEENQRGFNVRVLEVRLQRGFNRLPQGKRTRLSCIS